MSGRRGPDALTTSPGAPAAHERRPGARLSREALGDLQQGWADGASSERSPSGSGA